MHDLTLAVTSVSPNSVYFDNHDNANPGNTNPVEYVEVRMSGQRYAELNRPDSIRVNLSVAEHRMEDGSPLTDQQRDNVNLSPDRPRNVRNEGVQADQVDQVAEPEAWDQSSDRIDGPTTDPKPETESTPTREHVPADDEPADAFGAGKRTLEIDRPKVKQPDLTPADNPDPKAVTPEAKAVESDGQSEPDVSGDQEREGTDNPPKSKSRSRKSS